MRPRGCADRPGGRRKTRGADVAATSRMTRPLCDAAARPLEDAAYSRVFPRDEPQTMRVVRALAPT